MRREISGSEAGEQEAVIQYCDLKHIPVVHIPNEGKRSVTAGARLKRAGMRTGFPDLFVPRANQGYNGLFIEMKYGHNKPTEKQREWLKLLADEGYCCAVCYGFDEAVKVIERYLNK